MFDIWRKIEEKGAVAVPTRRASISALGWVEIGEEYPELMPEELRCHDVYSDPHLIRESPFLAVANKETKSWHFKAVEPVEGLELDGWIDPIELVSVLSRDYFHTDDGISGFGGVLVCSCGIAGCAGIWSQTFHVSTKMVHWSVVKNENELEFFFERETYEKGALTLLKSIILHPEEYTLPGLDDLLAEDALDAFRADVENLLDSRPYFREMWNEIGDSQA